MPKSLVLALGVLVLVVASVGFFVGYLGALDEPPPAEPVPPGLTQLPGAATYLGTVESVGDELVIVDENGEEHTYDADSVTVQSTSAAALESFVAGDLVVVAVERDAFGGPAVRYIVAHLDEATNANP